MRFTPPVNIFGMTGEKIIQTYCPSSDASLELMDELRADLEPVRAKRHAIPALWSGKHAQSFK